MPAMGRQQRPREEERGFGKPGKPGAEVGGGHVYRVTPLSSAQEIVSGDICVTLTSGGQKLPVACVAGKVCQHC